jgi:hypothetical protein
LFIAPDYRNFPQGTVSDMIEDITTALKWVFENGYIFFLFIILLLLLLLLIKEEDMEEMLIKYI